MRDADRSNGAQSPDRRSFIVIARARLQAVPFEHTSVGDRGGQLTEPVLSCFLAHRPSNGPTGTVKTKVLISGRRASYASPHGAVRTISNGIRYQPSSRGPWWRTPGETSRAISA